MVFSGHRIRARITAYQACPPTGMGVRLAPARFLHQEVTAFSFVFDKRVRGRSSNSAATSAPPQVSAHQPSHPLMAPAFFRHSYAGCHMVNSCVLYSLCTFQLAFYSGEEFSFLCHSFIHLYEYGCMDSYLNQRVIICYCNYLF